MAGFERWFELFVPGRVCLFGEHSDWAGGYRRINSEIMPGQVVIAGTNQGLYARAKAHPDALVIHPALHDGLRPAACILPMKREALLQAAAAGGFYSYAAGVAYYMLTFYRVKGLELDNYQTTLPVKKGLSSSAAFSVLLARAFNKVYDLKLTVRAEMEAAYQGEIMTPSRCGRMDQGCAFGQVPVQMTFDGELLKTHQLRPGGNILLLLADLKGKKNTIRILGDLNRAYPFASDEPHRRIQNYLGPVNTEIVDRATRAIEAGEAEKLGQLMTEAQRQFDAVMMPACPTELTAPKLHTVLADPAVQTLSFGGKGVGSQGDGCVQFVARSEADRQKLIQYLQATYGMDCFPLDLKPPPRVRKALIPVAGFGTRMFPASKAIKKELFPVVTPDGLAKPIILAIVEEAVSAGIEEIGLIIQQEDEALFSGFFNEPVSPEHFQRLSAAQKKYCQYLQDLGERLTFLPQVEQHGFGHAVYCAKEWIGAEPFLLMLGDHLYVSTTETPCARQLIDAFERTNDAVSVLSLYVEEISRVSHYGTVTGKWIEGRMQLLEIAEFAEKPSQEYAREQLVTPGLEEDRFLCVFGQYVLTPKIFEHLERQVAADSREAGEIQLTTALESLRKEQGFLGLRVDGTHYDTGMPGPYVQALGAVYGK